MSRTRGGTGDSVDGGANETLEGERKATGDGVGPLILGAMVDVCRVGARTDNGAMDMTSIDVGELDVGEKEDGGGAGNGALEIGALLDGIAVGDDDKLSGAAEDTGDVEEG